jgi:iron complex transport system substrate-binding protein
MRGVRGSLLTRIQSARTRPSQVLAATAAVLVLAGCSVPKGKAENESSLKLAHAAGETRVPAQADRVVALSPDSLDVSLALGVKPVAAATFPDGHLPTYLKSRTPGIEPAGTYAKPFLNAVDYVGPDLILGEKDLQRRYYGRLNRIASTIFSADRGHSWEVNTRLFGEALGRTDQAEKLLSAYDRLAERTRRRLDSQGDKRVSIVRVLPDGQVRAAGARSFAGVIVGQAGLGRPASQQRERDAVKLRSVAALDGDIILLSVAPGAERGAGRLQGSVAWRRLKAVRAGEVHRVSDDPWRTGGGVLAAELAQRDLARLLAP